MDGDPPLWALLVFFLAVGGVVAVVGVAVIVSVVGLVVGVKALVRGRWQGGGDGEG
ncbi:hypothetical protein [Streptomyces sp. NPDC059994]|uniref:hypothetical protein n=1 Tax=Streptomyces sp. NPDC059994 TaxID=3347029 RepID=UPI0036C471D5